MDVLLSMILLHFSSICEASTHLEGTIEDAWSNHFYIGSLIVICLLSTVGNFLVAFTLLKKGDTLSPSNRLVFSLSSSNLAVALLVLPFAVASSIKDEWIFGIFWCNFTAFITLLVIVASVLTLAAIAVDRYYAIVKPMVYSIILTNSKSIVMLLLVWSFAFLCSSPPLFGWSRFDYHPECSLCFVLWENSSLYTAFVLCVSFLLPLIIMLACYARIFQVARSKCCKIHVGAISKEMENSQLSHYSLQNSNTISISSEKQTPQRKLSWLASTSHSPVKSFAIIFIIIGAFLLTWCPYIIVIILQCFFKWYSLPIWQKRISLSAAFCSSLSYPLIYGLLNKSIRKDIISVWYSFRSKSAYLRTHQHKLTTVPPSLEKLEHTSQKTLVKFLSSQEDQDMIGHEDVSTNLQRKTSQDSGTYSTTCDESEETIETTVLPGTVTAEMHHNYNNMQSSQHLTEESHINDNKNCGNGVHFLTKENSNIAVYSVKSNNSFTDQGKSDLQIDSESEDEGIINDKQPDK